MRDGGGSSGNRRRPCDGRFGLAWLLVVLAMAVSLALPVAWAQGGHRHYTVTGWSMEDGLPHPLVHAVAQDRDGFLWAGTWEGVVRFNGRNFTVFDRQNTPGVELAGVFCIWPEADGGVLFCTARDGVYRYRDGHWQPLGGEDARHLQVTALLRDRRDGALWLVSGQRLLRLDAAGHLADIGASGGLPAGAPTVLAQDADGTLLVGGEFGLRQLRQERFLPWAAWAGTLAVRDLRDDGAGGWLVAGDDGVHWRHADGRIEHIKPGLRVEAVVKGPRNGLWMNLSTGALLHLDDTGQQRMAIPGAVSKALLVDREGLIWAGSTDGLFRVADGIASGITRRDGLGSDFVRTVLQADDGTWWIGHTNGLDRWRQGKLDTVRLGTNAGVHDTSVLSLAWRDGALWVGTYDLGVFRLDRQGNVLAHIRIGDGQQPLVRALLPDADGGVWIGGSHGLVHDRNGHQRHWLHAGDDAATVQALYRDADGTLWIGTDNGMAMLDAAGTLRRWWPERDLPVQNVFDFYRAPAGDLWIATDRGLLRMLPDGRFHLYDHRVGMPRDKVFRIIDDQAGNFWLSSNMGVFRIPRVEFDQLDAGSRTRLAVHVVDHSDGMPGSQCNGATMAAGWRTREGRLLFPTSAGLAVIDPGSGSGLQRALGPPVALERILVDGVQQPAGPRLQLPAGAKRLSVEYAGMSFRAPGKLRYRYRLKGFDPYWVDADNTTSAVYTSLPPGQYTLEVQAMSLPLDWSRQAQVGRVRLQIEVQPAVWQRTSVRALAAVVLVAGILLLWWLRTARFRRSQQRLNRIIAQRTEELSDKNHQLEVASWRLAFQATHDELTGLPNRREGDRFLSDAVSQAAQRPLSVALLDIDHFKQVNDDHGHAAGDAVLRAFGQELAGFAAEWGLFVARFGGEEFLLCMEEVALDNAERRMSELLQRVRDHAAWLEEGGTLRCTFSAGVAEWQPGQSAHALLAVADARLLQAKQAGRNRVMAGEGRQSA